MVLCVWLQVPQLVGDHVDPVQLRPGRLAGAVLDLLPDDGPVPQDGVGVELDDQVGGAGAQQLGRGDGGGGHCGDDAGNTQLLELERQQLNIIFLHSKVGWGREMSIFSKSGCDM